MGPYQPVATAPYDGGASFEWITTERTVPNIELKAHCNDPARAVAVLQQHGASVVRDHVETDTYFAVPEGRLKYRESPVRDSRLIAYFRTDQRTQRDSHFQIAATEPGVHVIKSVLTRALGVRAVVTKRRVTLEHPHGWLANVDRFVDHTFVELEFEYTTPDQRATSETTMALVKDSLGIRDEDILPWSYELVGSLITRSAS